MFHLWGIEARIQNVITDAPHREKGYGTALLDYAIKVLPEIYPIGRECLGIYKETLAARPNAEGFYEKRGFSLDEQEYKRLIHPAMFIGS
jgi:GNAT superfamily N-acetyltransferase